MLEVKTNSSLLLALTFPKACLAPLTNLCVLQSGCEFCQQQAFFLYFFYFFFYLLSVSLVQSRQPQIAVLCSFLLTQSSFQGSLPFKLCPQRCRFFPSFFFPIFLSLCSCFSSPPPTVCVVRVVLFTVTAPWIKVRSDHKRGGKVVLR